VIESLRSYCSGVVSHSIGSSTC